MSKDKHSSDTIFYICTGGKCKKKGSKEISKMLRAHAERQGLTGLEIIKTHCTDNCKHGPVVCIQPHNTWHFHVDEHKAIALVNKHAERK